jgi:hypothetical protein
MSNQLLVSQTTLEPLFGYLSGTPNLTFGSGDLFFDGRSFTGSVAFIPVAAGCVVVMNFVIVPLEQRFCKRKSHDSRVRSYRRSGDRTR